MNDARPMNDALRTSALVALGARAVSPCESAVTGDSHAVQTERQGDRVDPVGLLCDLFSAWSNLSREAKPR